MLWNYLAPVAALVVSETSASKLAQSCLMKSLTACYPADRSAPCCDITPYGSWIDFRYAMMAPTSLLSNTNSGISGWPEMLPSPSASSSASIG
jgi:hypothetical protein